MSTKFKFLGLSMIATILLTLGAAAAASGLINVRNPETVGETPGLVPPLLAPPGQEDYIKQRSDVVIAAPDGRHIAQFANPPADLAQSIAVNLPDTQPVEANEVAYTILSSVRYEGHGHTVLVTTARPSPAAAQQPTVFGNQTFRLADGSTAWGMTGMPGEVPNRLVWVRGNLIITVASDLPLDDVKALAIGVIIRP